MILNGLPWETNRDHSVLFEIAPKYCISYSFVDYENYSISTQGFLPSSRYNSNLNWIRPFQSILIHWSLKCRCSLCHLLFDHFHFTLIHGSNIPGSYAILFFTTLGFTSITSHIHSWALFSLRLCLFILSEVISPLFSNSILSPTDLRSSSFSVISFCLFILFMGFSRQEYWSGLPFPSPGDHILSVSPLWPVLGGPTWHGL